MHLENIETSRLLPVAVIPRAEHALPLAEALLEGGLNHIEITLRTECALEAIAAIRKAFPEMIVGAGTVLDPGSIPQLTDMGVAFAVSPGLNPAVVEACQSASLPIFPGVITPSEVETALGLGLRTLKFFPAEAAGGARMLKALSGPYGHTGIRFVPTGGIQPKLLPEYLALPTLFAIGGSWFVDKSLLLENRFNEVTQRTREALALTKVQVLP
jgi:2-dehydro-3-deoxyphosphogluconate aldolase/(4S)-4-hydroxy-2-oxoglutarate aldolase